MKLFRFLLVAFTCLSLTSCVEIIELFEIKKDGSGSWSTSTDLKELVDMMEAMGGEEFQKAKGTRIDSTIFLKDVAAGKKLSEAETKLVGAGTVKIKMDLEAKEFLIRSNYPFSSLSNLQELTKMSSVMGMDNLITKLMSPEGSEEGSDNQLQDMLSVFDHEFSEGLIKKTVNNEKLKKLLEDPKITEMKQGAEMGIEIIHSVTYQLPSTVKKVDNAKAVVSEDKKSVTLRQNLLDIFSKPESFAITVQY